MNMFSSLTGNGNHRGGQFVYDDEEDKYGFDEDTAKLVDVVSRQHDMLHEAI